MARDRKRKPIIERLYAKTIIPITNSGTKDVSKCWIWQGGTNNAGYGLIKVGRDLGMKTVHRVVREHYNPFNTSLEVQHTCGNKLCVNPDHLTVGDVNTRVINRPTGPNNWLLRDEQLFKKCDDCGIETHRLWFSRKHKNCKKE